MLELLFMTGMVLVWQLEKIRRAGLVHGCYTKVLNRSRQSIGVRC